MLTSDPNPRGPATIAERVRMRRLLVTQTLDVLALWGYAEAEVPLLAPWDALRDAIGDDVANELFRFTDRAGQLLVLRGDVTPVVAWQLARLAAERAEPMRIAYAEGVARHQRAFARQQTESFELGAELWGVNSAAADLEAIVVCLDSLHALGIDEVEVHVGHVALLAGIPGRLAASSPAQRAIHDALVQRDRTGIAQHCDELGFDPALRALLLALCALAPDRTPVNQIATDPRFASLAPECARVTAVLDGLDALGNGARIYFDPAAINDRGYYTGVRFRVVCAQTGVVLATGGRYDELLRRFRADCPAVGFGLRVDALLERAHAAMLEPADNELLFDAGVDPNAAIAAAREMRRAGSPVRIAHNGGES
jgi:ATP phosphoribosyltransferase regulatory subunit